MFIKFIKKPKIGYEENGILYIIGNGYPTTSMQKEFN